MSAEFKHLEGRNSAYQILGRVEDQLGRMVMKSCLYNDRGFVPETEFLWKVAEIIAWAEIRELRKFGEVARCGVRDLLYRSTEGEKPDA